MHYLYFAFTNYKDDIQHVMTRKRYEKKYGKSSGNKHGEKNKHVFLYRKQGLIHRDPTPLRVVEQDDVLIIMGHGGKDETNKICVKQKTKGGKVQYEFKTQDQLAAQLEAEGLSKNHKVIKLISCYAGGASSIDSDNNQFIDANPDKEFFAQLLAKALGRRGYRNIVVGGYAGTVGSSRVGNPNKVFYPVVNDSTNRYDLDSDGEWGAGTKDQMFWFNSAGNLTTRTGA